MATKTDPTGAEVLALPMDSNDSGEDTIGGYLVALLGEVWRHGEGFSGKRPFGNSGWEWDLFLPLVLEGFVYGSVDSDGYLEDCDEDAARRLITAAIGALGDPHA